jgi:hypothetical protein
MLRAEIPHGAFCFRCAMREVVSENGDSPLKGKQNLLEFDGKMNFYKIP